MSLFAFYNRHMVRLLVYVCFFWVGLYEMYVPMYIYIIFSVSNFRGLFFKKSFYGIYCDFLSELYFDAQLFIVPIMETKQYSNKAGADLRGRATGL